MSYSTQLNFEWSVLNEPSSLSFLISHQVHA